MFSTPRDKLLLAALKSMNDLIFLFDLHGNFAEVFYPEDERLFMEPQHFIGKGYKEVLPSHLVVELECAFDALNKGEKLYEFRYKLEVHGVSNWYHGKMTSVFSEDNRQLGFMGDIRKITRMVELEEALVRKEKMLGAVAVATGLLLDNSSYILAINQGLKLIGQATGVDRAYLFQNGYNPTTEVHFCSQKFEWSAVGAIPQIDNPDLQEVPFDEIGPHVYKLKMGEPFINTVSELEEGRIKELLQAQDILSILVLPIIVNGGFWGFIGFDECKFERLWDHSEYNLLKSYAYSVSSAIERESQVRALREAKTIAEDANREKGLFLSGAVFELNAPLKDIVNWANELRNVQPTQPSLLSATQRISEAAALAIYTVDGLIEFSLMETGHAKSISEVTPWMSWLDAVKESCATFVPNHKLHIRIDERIPDNVRLDAQRLQKIVLSLIASVGRKNQEEHILWDVKLGSTENGDVFEMEVKPCSAQAIHSKHMVFSQNSDGLPPKGYEPYKGQEIDLMVVNRLLQLFRTTLHVNADGDAYYFQLPLEAASSPKQTDPIENNYVFGGFDGSIMVLEDNELNMFIASTLLQTWMPNVRIVEMFNAFDALSFLERESVDLIFVDIELPQKNGFTVTRRIREMEQLAQKVFATPVIALTARSVEHTRELGLAAGMNDFLTKPIDADELKRVLTRFLSRTNKVS